MSHRHLSRALGALVFVAAGCGSTPLDFPTDGGAADIRAPGRDLAVPRDLATPWIDLSAPQPCSGPNPAGCASGGGACPPNSICSTNIKDGCAPSACSCDASTGSWVCTADCGGGVCVPVTTGTCIGNNPQGCANTGCPKGQVCDTKQGCFPSACKCDSFGMWSCTSDCGGGACVPSTTLCGGPNPQGCINTGCPTGWVCDNHNSCVSSACKCDATSGQWVCSKDCLGGVCVQSVIQCSQPSPAGCKQNGCPAGQVCDATKGCAPSACKCDTTTGKWTCTADCGGGICVQQTMITCPAPNPAGCLVNGCPTGQKCDTTVGCKSSYCKCDFGTGMWSCTNDCGGGTCVP